jgi:hypothetical protein
MTKRTTRIIYISIAVCVAGLIATLAVIINFTSFAYYSYKPITVEKEGIRLQVYLFTQEEFLSWKVPEDNTEVPVSISGATVAVDLEGRRSDKVEVTVNGLRLSAADNGERPGVEARYLFNLTFKGEVMLKNSLQTGPIRFVPYDGKVILWVGPPEDYMKRKKHVLEFRLEPRRVGYGRYDFLDPGV